MGRPDDTPPEEPGKPVDAPGKDDKPDPQGPPIETEDGGHGGPPGGGGGNP